MIPITRVELGVEEEQLVLEVLRSGQLAQGPMVARLETSFAALVGVRHAIAVNSGTTALVASLQALGIGPGQEVITSPFTFAATVNAILEAGADVRFADIGLDDFNVDPDAMRSLVGPRTAVLLPVHLYGQPAEIAAIASLADAHGLALVEDAAQAHGAEAGGRPVGSFGLGCFSFYATKNVTTGEGGVITTDDDDVADRLRVLRNQGMRARYDYEMAGHNYRLTDLQAAVGIPQLERLADVTKRRQANAAYLTEGLAGMPGLVTPAVLPERTHVFHQFTVRVGDDAPLGRDDMVRALAERGVGAGVYYPKLAFDYECYRTDPRVHLDDVPNARRATEQVLSLPVHAGLAPEELETIVEVVREVLDA